MLEVGGGLDLAQEALGADDGGQFGPEHLDGDLAVVLEVLGQVDGGHAALPELPLEAVAIRQGFGQAGEDVGHRDLADLEDLAAKAAARLVSLKRHSIAVEWWVPHLRKMVFLA